MDKGLLLERLTRARADLLAAIDGLDGMQMTTLPVAGAWTIKDILAHLSGWSAWDLSAIEGILAGRHRDFSSVQDVDSFNAQLVAERRDWAVDEILAEMRDIRSALHELLARMPGEELFRAGPFEGPYWESLAGLLRVAWEHEEEHAEHIRAWRT